jgi:phenylalanine-4-hydroxylase
MILMPRGLRAYGAGILSSAGELKYSVSSAVPQRLAFNLKRIMRTRYKIDSYQSTYFVVDSFEQLINATAPDFSPLYEELVTEEPIDAEGSVEGDRHVITIPPAWTLSAGWRPLYSTSITSASN